MPRLDVTGHLMEGIAVTDIATILTKPHVIGKKYPRSEIQKLGEERHRDRYGYAPNWVIYNFRGIEVKG